MTDEDPDAERAASLKRWARAAQGWGTHRAHVQATAQPVSAWLVDAIDPQPGHRVLELAAGPGDTGFLAAELIQPGGELISSDIAPEMVEQARARAAELGIENADFRTIDAQWIDLPTASLDGVLARWVHMLLTDPEAALRESRRVLRPGGRLALSVWAGPEDNPWVYAPMEELVAIGAVEPLDLDAPGVFALRDPGRIRELLERSGFTDIQIEQVSVVWRHADLDEWWDTQLDLSMRLAGAVTALTPAQRDDLRDAIDARLEQYVQLDGSVALPGRTNVASASA